MVSQNKCWFPAKRYGWGWGPPTCWKGWVVLVVYVASVALVFFSLPPARNIAAFVLSFSVLTAILVAVCWFKGEPPRWRLDGR